MKKFISYTFPAIKSEQSDSQDKYGQSAKKLTFIQIEASILVPEKYEGLIALTEDYYEGDYTNCTFLDYDGVTFLIPAKKEEVIDYLQNPENKLKATSNYYNSKSIIISEYE